MLFEIILGSVVVVAIITIFITIFSNKFQFAIIKIEEAENNIDVLLHKKLELLQRSSPIIIKELKLDDFLEKLENVKLDDINHFEFNDLLKESYNELLKTIDDNEKLLKSEALSNIMQDLEDNELELSAAQKFYNDAVIVFNKLIVSFPSSVIGFFKRYKKKEFYINEKREMYQILNEK